MPWLQKLARLALCQRLVMNLRWVPSVLPSPSAARSSPTRKAVPEGKKSGGLVIPASLPAEICNAVGEVQLTSRSAGMSPSRHGSTTSSKLWFKQGEYESHSSS